MRNEALYYEMLALQVDALEKSVDAALGSGLEDYARDLQELLTERRKELVAMVQK